MRRSAVKLVLAGVMMFVGTAGTCEEWCELNHESELFNLFCDDGHETEASAAQEQSLAEADVEAELEKLGL